MKPYDNLTYHGAARRLRPLALRALPHFDLEVTKIRLAYYFTNCIFRLRTPSGWTHLIRICEPGWRTETDLRAEIMWLLALQKEADICAPVPVPTHTGDYIVEMDAEGVPEKRRCVVMTWQPGVRMGLRLTAENLEKMGVLFAQLHRQAAGYTPPDGFSTRRDDNLYAREKACLFTDAGLERLTPSTRKVFTQAMERVDEAYRRLYADSTGLRVMHHDLYHDNISVYRGRLYPFDFEDTMWGYPVQDIATAIHDLEEEEPDRFPTMYDAFQTGYGHILPWPEQHPHEIDIFRAALMLRKANRVALREPDNLRDHTDSKAAVLERYLDTGALSTS